VSPRAPAGCRTYRQVLLSFLEDPLGGDLSQDARSHLDGCPACRADLVDVLLMGRTVRAALASPPDLEPTADAWLRLRARIARRPASVGRAASPVLGLAMAAGLAVALLLPVGAMRVGSGDTPAAPVVLHEAGLDPAAIIAAGVRDAEAEASRLRATARAGKEVIEQQTNTSARAALIRMETTLEPDPHSRAPRSYAASVE